MAPMTRNSSLIPPANGRSRVIGREPSWQFGEPDMAAERETSLEASSYNDEHEMMGRDEGDYEKQGYIEDEDTDKDLHPLREAANRVGREVERFAEVLDEYNPLGDVEEEERYGTALDLIDLYHETAKDTAARLREQHDAEKRRRDGLKWRRKMRGFKITLDDEDMQEEDDEKRVGDQQTTVEDLTRWEQEAQTWDLLRRLVEVRFSPHSGTEEARMEPKFHRYSTEREAWDDFLQTDTLALERRTVLQWLRDTAEETGEEIDVLVHDLQQNAERGDIIAHGWIHTKAAIKLQKRLHGWPEAVDPSSSEAQRALRNSSNTESLITQLDPDAVTRQKRKLEAQDEYFERAIWLGCYEMLRRGKTASQIKEWCSERTEVWRAISMCGLPDQNADDDDHGDATSSVLWRRMCFSLARRGGSDDYERAVYGILSGDISSVEPVCRSWDDFVFAHYNALLRSQFDSYLQSQYPPKQSFGTGSNFGAFDAVQFHGDPGTTGKRLVEALKTDSRISKETLQPMKMLQGVLIANQFEHFIYQQGLALSQYANATGQSFLIPSTDEKPENDQINRYVAINDHDGLRVLTHVLLIFMGLGVNFGGAVRQLTIQNVIVAYVSFLRLAGKEELIPLYCSRLSGTRKYATLCRNLIDVTDREQRVTQINLMRELGLDAQQFVTYQAAYLFADYPEKIAATEEYPAAGRIHLLEDVNDGSGRKVKRGVFDEDEEVDRKDKLLIRSLEWYLLVDGLWSETFTIGTLIYQRFFKHLRFTAALKLADTMPSATIAESKTRVYLGQSLNFEQLEQAGEDEDLTEVLDGSAEEKRLMKKHLVAQAKNYRELEVLISSLNTMDTIATFSYLMNDQENPTVQKKAVRYQLAGCAQALRPMAKSLFKGWLLTAVQPQDEERLSKLREAYLPETILAYISTLQLSGELLSRDLIMECMDLATLLAAEDSDILDLFVEVGRMEELVEAFAYAGKSLLLLTSAKSSSSRTKKIRSKGWTQELWSVK